MSYATTNDLIAWCGLHGQQELIELTDPDNFAMDSTLVAAKLDQADHEINARLVGVTLPLSAPYPQLLIDIACRIARFLLYTSGRPEYVTDDYLSALKTLDDIRMGKATLGLSGDGTTAMAVPVGVRLGVSASVFTDTMLEAL